MQICLTCIKSGFSISLAVDNKEKQNSLKIRVVSLHALEMQFVDAVFFITCIKCLNVINHF